MNAVSDIKFLPLKSNSVDMIFTDPPYLKAFLETYKWLACEAFRVLKPGGFLLAMCGGNYLNKIFRYFDESGLIYYWNYQNGMTGQRAGIVWKHSDSGNQPIQIRSKSILAYYKPDGNDKNGRSVSRTPTSGWYDGNGKSKIYHVWGQDVESARYYIDCFSDKGDLICDPFVGGGTTAAACDVIGRRFVGFDVDENSIKTTNQRMRTEHSYLRNLPLFQVEKPGKG